MSNFAGLSLYSNDNSYLTNKPFNHLTNSEETLPFPFGKPSMDSLHIACAIYSQCDYFLTTDDKVLKKSDIIEEINIVDPFGFIKEVSL